MQDELSNDLSLSIKVFFPLKASFLIYIYLEKIKKFKNHIYVF